ncbi:uncharacterized protein LOC115925828 [Strongylocentrotus purpuratus]|uniref:Endonuclease/exonuclease/phosphatase domain-containing protein n=1 Tax=Strongylocentrotus purpuratus TaxID=7668 RepID=A0A7M7P3M3_STRPU|nr:uncharacterized protein LOC115925828 [Strongylocentrotus purpuratus]
MTDTNKQRPPVPSSSFVPDQGGGPIKQGAGGAKNPWVRTGHQWKLNIATYNVRSLLQEERLLELEEELQGIKWDIVGLGEVRRRGEELTVLKSGHHFYHIGKKNNSEAGVGFLVHKSIADVKTINKVNVGSDHRMVMGKMKINTRLERQKLLKPKQSSINLEKLKEKRTEFQLELKNQLQLLTDKCTDEEGNRSLETWTDLLVEKTPRNRHKDRREKTKNP